MAEMPSKKVAAKGNMPSKKAAAKGNMPSKKVAAKAATVTLETVQAAIQENERLVESWNAPLLAEAQSHLLNPDFQARMTELSEILGSPEVISAIQGIQGLTGKMTGVAQSNMGQVVSRFVGAAQVVRLVRNLSDEG